MVDVSSSGEMYRLLSGADESTKRRVHEIRDSLEARFGEQIAPADLERALWLAAGRDPASLCDRLQDEGQDVSRSDIEQVTNEIERTFTRDIDRS